MRKVKPPPHRRKFKTEWDEIGYLSDKLLYWLYQREDVRKARPYADRLECLLRKVDAGQESILGQECRSLIHEANGDLRKAIEHRKKETELIRRLHEISRNTPAEDLMLRDYGYDALSDRLDLLATLYHDAGQLDQAISTLRESKQVSRAHGLKFDGEDLLQEYLAEKKNLPAEVGKDPRRIKAGTA
jgi:tetratricopeptide (TPR) repeat protein